MFPPLWWNEMPTPSPLWALSIQMTSYLDISFHHRGLLNLEKQEICSFCDDMCPQMSICSSLPRRLQPIHTQSMNFMKTVYFSWKVTSLTRVWTRELSPPNTNFHDLLPAERPQLLMFPQSPTRIPPARNQALGTWAEATVQVNLTGTVGKKELYECVNCASVVFKESFQCFTNWSVLFWLVNGLNS